jgi:hypothetical protein
MLTRRLLTLIGVSLLPAVAAAQSTGSILFAPDVPPTTTAPGRSLERERDPKAWGIDDAQWMRFQAAAKASGRQIKVIVRLNNLRARQFKEDLTELLQSIPGWEVEDQGVYTAGTLPPFDGILIQNISSIEPSADALAIKQALDAAGILPTATFDPTMPGAVRVVIGAPPQ